MTNTADAKTGIEANAEEKILEFLEEKEGTLDEIASLFNDRPMSWDLAAFILGKLCASGQVVCQPRCHTVRGFLAVYSLAK